MTPAGVRRMLGGGMTRADIARAEGCSRQWVTMFIRANLPDLHGQGREEKLAAGAARRDHLERARVKRQAFKAVLREARSRGWEWKTIADWLGEDNWKRLQALERSDRY